MAAGVEAQAESSLPAVDGSEALVQESGARTAPKKPRVKRPNYNEIHAKPLPVEVYPLPAFIPHNPISIVRIAITLLSHSVRRPVSRKTIHRAYFSPETQSVHVTDPSSIRALWEQGFWGSGSLSRSEPRWLDQEKRKRGIEAATTSEEITRGRREERRQFKLERAKAQREAIEQQLREEGKLDADTKIEELVEDGSVAESPRGTLYQADASVPLGGDAAAREGSLLDQVQESIARESSVFNTEITDQEHLQLTFEETFFLSYVLGILEIYQDDALLRPLDVFRAFCTCSEFPYQSKVTSSTQTAFSDSSIAPDDPFVLKYVVFHHFRSLGWVVRPGIKFACDYLLYLRGPAFHHAEFAIMIIPSYSHPYWSETGERAETSKKKEQKDWWWLHRVNRVQTQVHKTLMLVYVEVPPPWDEEHPIEGSVLDLGKTLAEYRVRESIWKRWSPNRNRD